MDQRGGAEYMGLGFHAPQPIHHDGHTTSEGLSSNSNDASMKKTYSPPHHQANAINAEYMVDFVPAGNNTLFPETNQFSRQEEVSIETFAEARLDPHTEAQSSGKNGPTLDAQVQEARDRAINIIRMFHNQGSSSDYARKRQEALEQLEKRKRRAMVRNLEYIAKVEDERLKSNLLKVQQTQEYHAKLQASHQKSLEARMQYHHHPIQNTTTQAGIGTQQRVRAENRRKEQQKRSSSSGTVALYVSNLPIDGPGLQDVLQSLFGSLGYSLRKIHIYLNKATNIPKGDALVVYELPEDQDRKVLIESVCSQMNGAELSCGTVIKVEASDPLYKLRKKNQTLTGHYGPTSKNQTNDNLRGCEENTDAIIESNVNTSFESPEKEPKAVNSIEKEADDAGKAQETDQDLDDFFDSIGD